jgi:protein-tyrosine phosphatase
MFLFGNREKTCVRIPLKTKGKLYVSPMPFGPYDAGNALLKIYKQNQIQFVIMLVTDEELARKAKRDILTAYKKVGIEPIRFPFADYTSPELHQFSKVVDQVAGYLFAGANVAVHCNAGVGRTGVMTCCIVRDIMKIPAQESIDYVKQYMQTNMTDEQMRLVGRFHTLEERVKEQSEASQ